MQPMTALWRGKVRWISQQPARAAPSVSPGATRARIYSHTLLRISFRSTVKLSSCHKQSFLSSLHTVWDLTRASCCVAEGGEEKLKGAQISWGRKIKKEKETDKSLPQAHYVICVISYEQR